MDNQRTSSKDNISDLTQNPHSHKAKLEENNSTKASKPKKVNPSHSPSKKSGICETVRELELKVQEIKKKMSSQTQFKDHSKLIINYNKIAKSKQIEYEKVKIQRYNERMESKILNSAKNWTKSRKPIRKPGFFEDCLKISSLLNDFDHDEIFMKFNKILKKRADLANFNYFEPDIQIVEDVTLELDWLELSPEVFFKGEMKNHRPEGRGVLLSKLELYEGYFVNGLKQGLGRQVTSSKVYTGYWFNNLYSGFGTLAKKSSVYSGEFEFGKESGFGVLKRKEARYEGSWKIGKQHGPGVIKFDDGRIYKGEFYDGAIKGYGSIIWPNGKSLVGYWQNGEIVGNPQKVYLPLDEIPDIPMDEDRVDSVRSQVAVSEVNVDFDDRMDNPV